MNRLIALLLFSLVFACQRPAEEASPGPPPKANPTAASASKGPSPSPSQPSQTPAGAQAEPPLDYIEWVTGGANVSQTLPLIVAVHGLGDRPENFLRWLRGLPFPARIIAPRAPLSYGRGYSWFPIERVFGALDEADRAAIRSSTERLARLIAHLTNVHPTRGKPIILGFSQGGVLSFSMAVHHPTIIGAALPIAGTWVGARVGAHKGPIAPIYGFHGAADTRIPIGLAEGAVAQLAAGGRPAVLNRYPGVRHTISPAMRQRIFELLSKLTL